MASAHRRSGVRGLPPPNRCVFTCLGIKGCSTVHNSADMPKPVVTLFMGARLRRFLVCVMHSIYQIWVIRIGSKGQAAPDVAKVYTRARALCQQLGETSQLFPVILGLRRFYLAQAELQTAR